MDIFHPHVTASGSIPMLLLSPESWRSLPAIIAAVHGVLKEPPSPNPSTWVNLDAAEMYFQGGEAGRAEYLRKAKRCAQRTMDY